MKRSKMSSEPNLEEKQFHHLKVNFFKCVTDVLQFLVKRLHTTEIKNLFRSTLGADPDHGYYFQTVGSAHSSMAQKWFMDSQHSIINAGDFSKMNIATCFTVLHSTNVCGLQPPESGVWIDKCDRRPLEYQITLMMCQLINVVYSEDTFDIIRQNNLWDELIETIRGMKTVLVEDYYSIDFDESFSDLVERWNIRKEFENVDLTEYTRMLDFIVRREILENLNSLKSASSSSPFIDFCLNKIFSKFKISHLNKDELISYTEIFDWKDEDKKYPEIYVICGDQGVGKSFYMKYVHQQFSSDSSTFTGIDKFDAIIYIESLDNTAYCLVDYINSNLQVAATKFKLNSLNIQEIMLRGKILVMMDSFDVATPETHQLLNELTSISTNNITLMIATRPDSLENLSEKLPKNKNAIILFPEVRVGTSLENQNSEQKAEIKGVTDSSEVSIVIPPGYETSYDSKVIMDVETLRKELNEMETVTINDETPKDKKKPSARTIKNASSKLNSLIEQFRTAADQLCDNESDVKKSQLQEMLDEYEDLHKETDTLNKKLPPGMRTELYKSGESLFQGILYWVQRIGLDHGITSTEILDDLESNYSKVKDHLHPKPKINIEPDRERPSFQVIMNSVGTLGELHSSAKKAVTMIENNGGRTDHETKINLLEMVTDIRNLRERCDSFNASLPKVVMFSALCERRELGIYDSSHDERRNLGIFLGLEYFLYMITSEMSKQPCQIGKNLIKELDEFDKKIRNHLLKPQNIQPKLAKSWKSDDLSTNKKTKAKKSKPKKKSKTGW